MIRFFLSRPAFLLCLSLSLISVSVRPSLGEDKSESPIIVDFAAGTVGGVKLRGDIGEIRRAVGANRVTKETEYLEGEPSDMYIVSFGKHKIFIHWNAFSYNDPIFKTKDGLGVGSKVQDFNSAFGQGRVSQEEGFAIYYKTNKIQISVGTKFIEGREQNIQLYTSSKLDEIYVW